MVTCEGGGGRHIQKSEINAKTLNKTTANGSNEIPGMKVKNGHIPCRQQLAL